MLLNSQQDVFYLPRPNVVNIMASSILACDDLTMTSFMVPLLANGSVVLANNVRRGVEIPGGHKEKGESLCQGAHRETYEETGAWVSNIRAIGYLEMKSTGEAPPGWRYPHPLSYQQFFVGMVLRMDPYVANDECHAPVILSREEAFKTLPAGRLALYKEALRVMGR